MERIYAEIKASKQTYSQDTGLPQPISYSQHFYSARAVDGTHSGFIGMLSSGMDAVRATALVHQMAAGPTSKAALEHVFIALQAMQAGQFDASAVLALYEEVEDALLIAQGQEPIHGPAETSPKGESPGESPWTSTTDEIPF